MQHNADYVLSRRSGRLFSYDQPHMFHPSAMFIAGGNDVNTGGIDTAVTENVGELGNVLFNVVKNTSEQVAQIVGKHLLWIYPRLLTKVFHFSPNVGSAQRSARSCNENCT